ncbi:MAG: helix-turn-helix transcriptional regulator [Clostridia bacterium]|nr:helix-turn-helix transcriptional regulator [Clostridia bacterium]
MKTVKHTEPFLQLRAFEVFMSYSEIDRTCPENTHDSHIHNEYEMYVNLAGNVSFEVGGTIYPVSHGDIIIARPYEYHHCIYHDKEEHRFFWALFNLNGNEFVFDEVFDKVGKDERHFSLSKEDTDEFVSLCYKFTEDTLSETEKYYNFFRLISLLKKADAGGRVDRTLPGDIVFSVDYIEKNLAFPISINLLAKEANVSVNTLERHFMQTFNMSPHEYIKKKRLANAAKLLACGETVASASEKSGFSDYSNFIVNFKKYYGMTPFKYKKTVGG